MNHMRAPQKSQRLKSSNGADSVRGGGSHESVGKNSSISIRSSNHLQNSRRKPINITRTMTTMTTTTTAANMIEYGVECVNNKVQKQIERMFTDVAKDESACCFPVHCLGSLPLRSKVNSLHDMQEPLRKLYLAGVRHAVSRRKSIFFWTLQ